MHNWPRHPQRRLVGQLHRAGRLALDPLISMDGKTLPSEGIDP
jgi:hypothetical protein